MIFRKLLKWQFMAAFLAVAFFLQYILIGKFLPEFYGFSEGIKNPDQLFWYTKDWLKRLYGVLGAEGRMFYQKMLLVDFFYAGFAAAGYAMLLFLLAKNTKWRWTFATPLVMTFFDYLENVSQIILLNMYPIVNSAMAFVSSVFSLLKMTFSFIGILLVVIFVLRLIILGIKRLRRKPISC